MEMEKKLAMSLKTYQRISFRRLELKKQSSGAAQKYGYFQVRMYHALYKSDKYFTKSG